LTEKVEKLSKILNKKLTEKGEDERGGGSGSEEEAGGSTLWDRLQRRLEAQRGGAVCGGEGGGMGRDCGMALKSVKVPSLKSLKVPSIKGHVEETGEIMVATREEGGSKKEEEAADGEEEDLFAPRGADLARKNAGRAEGAHARRGEGGCQALGGGGQRQEEQGQRESDLGRARASETERGREEEAEARASDTEREREEEAERIMATLDEVCVCVCVCVCVRACMHACVRACVRACVYGMLISTISCRKLSLLVSGGGGGGRRVEKVLGGRVR
jgi:hypothetical protein